MSMPTSSMPPGENTCMNGVCFSSTWTSISRTSRPPARSFSRIFSRDCSPWSASAVDGVAGRRGSSRSSSRSSASSSAFFWTLASSSAFTMLTATSTRSRTMDSTSRPTYPTSVYRVASTFTNGAETSWASRRAISVFPTPVGPMSMMFLGEKSPRSSGPSCCRRQRLRTAMATTRLAASCPTMCLSSSSTTRRGVRPEGSFTLEYLDLELGVGVDADLGGDLERFPDDLPRGQLRVLHQRPGRRHGEGAARADPDDAVVRLDDVALPRDQQRALLVRDQQEGLQAPQEAVGAPFLRKVDRRLRDVPLRLLEHPLELV